MQFQYYPWILWKIPYPDNSLIALRNSSKFWTSFQTPYPISCSLNLRPNLFPTSLRQWNQQVFILSSLIFTYEESYIHSFSSHLPLSMEMVWLLLNTVNTHIWVLAFIIPTSEIPWFINQAFTFLHYRPLPSYWIFIPKMCIQQSLFGIKNNTK